MEKRSGPSIEQHPFQQAFDWIYNNQLKLIVAYCEGMSLTKGLHFWIQTNVMEFVKEKIMVYRIESFCKVNGDCTSKLASVKR